MEQAYHPRLCRLPVAGFARKKPMKACGAILTMMWSVLASGAVFAQEFYGDKKYGEFYEDEKKWVEAATSLPAYPSEENLIEFDAGAATRNRYYIDATAVSVGGDGVVRYTIVVKTAGGATNVSYEGIRCATGERKLFAFGRNDGTWAPSHASWQAIRPGSYQAVLSREYFCPNRVAIFRAEEGVAALKGGGHPDAR